MRKLETLLDQKTWTDLKATTLAHGWSFNVRHTKRQSANRLFHLLTADEGFRRHYRLLNPAEVDALCVLQARGSLPLAQYRAMFGAIRPYRPWDPDAPRAPWKTPISTAEKLWYLAFIDVIPGTHGEPDRVVAPAEVLALLPPLPAPLPAPRIKPSPYAPDALRIDLAAFLGSLLYEDARPRWGRWLAPRMLRSMNARLSAPDDLQHVRGELQTGRIRFLHYLAEAAGLVGLQAGMLRPTVEAWAWLDASPAGQWRIVWEGWQRDLAGAVRLWDRYRFPPLPGGWWGALCDQLAALEAGQPYTLDSVIAALQPYLSSADAASLPDLLRGPLAWAGLAVGSPGALAITAAGAALLRGAAVPARPPFHAALKVMDHALWIDLPAVPAARPLAEVVAFAGGADGRLHFDAAAVRRAVGRGHTARQMIGALARLCGPLPPEAAERIEGWARQAHHLRLRTLTVLTAAEADQLDRLRADRRVRLLLGERLSAHHITVDPHHVGELERRLARRRLPVSVERSAELPTPEGDLTPEMAAYLWLAVRAYRRLGDLAAPPVPIPAAVLDWLAARLPADQLDALAQAADGWHEQLAALLEGRAAPVSPVAQDDPDGIRAAVERAFETRTALTVDYLSPARGEVTRRTIEPITPITRRGDAEYIEAWCRTADAPRTFRVDRILRIVEL